VPGDEPTLTQRQPVAVVEQGRRNGVGMDHLQLVIEQQDGIAHPVHDLTVGARIRGQPRLAIDAGIVAIVHCRERPRARPL